MYEKQSIENRTPAIKHVPRKSWQHCLYVSMLPKCRVGNTHRENARSTQLFLYCSGGERSAKCVRPALETEARKEEQRGGVRFCVLERVGTRDKVKTHRNAVGRNHSFA